MAEPPRTARARLRRWARAVRRDVLALSLAARDPRVPWYAKALALVVAGYALSPVDLVPDFIPVLGYLDDVILVPAGILLVRRLIPADLLAEHRAAAEHLAERPTSRTAGVVIVGVWVATVALTLWFAWPVLGERLRFLTPGAR